MGLEKVVAVVWKDGRKAWINEKDFDPKKHVLWVEPEEGKKRKRKEG